MGREKKKTFIEKLKNEQWTRVIALDDFSFVDYKLHCLKDDLIEFQTRSIMFDKKAWQKWKMIFNPKDASIEMESDRLDDYALNIKDLKSYAEQISTQRRKIRYQALEEDKRYGALNLADPTVTTKLA
jgi:hypothetical protein